MGILLSLLLCELLLYHYDLLFHKSALLITHALTLELLDLLCELLGASL